MRNIFFLGFFLSCFSFYGQHKINDYKYVVVDNKFDFLKKGDQYQTSSLTKFLFNKIGFTSFLSNEQLHADINTNKCASLFASVVNESSMLTTKLTLVLKDCNNNVIHKSSIGKSKEKVYKKSYQEAIRNAFKDPVINSYSYKPQKPGVVKTKKLAVVKTVTANTNTPVKINAINASVKNILYAQVTDNGFQLVDTTPKVVFKVLKTNQENIFIIEDKNGILFKKGNLWIAEFYEDNVLIKKEYQVRF